MKGKWRGPPHASIAKCGANTRAGNSCGRMAMKNGRCNMHGGKSTGAKNPYRSIKHGFYTKEAMEQRTRLTTLLKESIGSIIEIA